MGRATQHRRVGELIVRPHEHTVYVGTQEVPLTEREYEIVALLSEHPGWVCTPGQLSDISGEDDRSPESITVLVSRLRHKLAEAGAGEVIQTVRGFGYRLHVGIAGDHEREAGESGTELQGMRDAAWSLNEAVVRLEQAGTPEEMNAATRALTRATGEIASLGEDESR